MMKQSLLGLLVAAIGTFAVPASAAAASIEIAQFDAGHVLINFDDLADGTVVDNEYAGLGVLISGTTGNDGGGGASAVTALFTGGASSQPNYIGQPQNNFNGSIVFDFSVPIDQFGLISVDSAGTWLSVYGAGNVLLETVFGDGALYDFIGIDTNGTLITRAIISGAFYAADDVRFNSAAAAVPEPASLMLFGSGAAYLTRRMRRRRD